MVVTFLNPSGCDESICWKKADQPKRLDLALNRLEKEAQQKGRSLREQLMISVGEYWKALHSQPDAAALQFKNLPVEFFRELINSAQAVQADARPADQKSP